VPTRENHADLPQGLYDALLTAGLTGALAGRPELHAVTGTVEADLVPELVARHVGDVVRRTLAEVPADQRVAVANRLLAAVPAPDAAVEPGPTRLLALVEATAPGVYALRPQTPLADAALLTNARDEPSLAAELRAELASSSRVDLLCAFVKFHGLRLLEAELTEMAERGVPLRVITTTYVGATERRALDELVRRYGATVKISYERLSTRLHAKAWLFRRATGYDTAYVGSSNLSRSALLEGLEWNVRLAAVATPALLAKFAATFDSYWADEAFETYDPDRDSDRLDDALAEASGRTEHAATTVNLSGLEVRPYPHQAAMLEALNVERQVHDRHRNLVVAATGTGKTVVAALDYRRLAEQFPAPAGARPSLLFVAHRTEILTQSLRTYREVLSDAAFGEVWVGGTRPERGRHVFASVQSLAAHGVHHLDPAAFDVVVVDEFHHAEAPTYRRLLDRLEPRELLGLTATPERGDGVDVRAFFGGRTAAELRLWDALDADLLCPFHYFGVADGTDLSGIEWKRGSYDVAGLDRVYTGNDARARIVLREVRDKVADPGRMRALGFCVSVAHAAYMARVFRDAGIPALAVSGDTPAAERQAALAALRSGTVCVLFAVDLFNEGLDLPDVDTVLFLRPTQSATVFLQQLGRGLRRAPGKAVLTVLDFLGTHRKEFRFDVRYRALTGVTRRELERSVIRGFPYLPSGCQLLLDRVAAQTVLDNLRAQVGITRPRLVAEIRSYGDLPLAQYLSDSGREVADVYRRGSWTALRRDAGLPTAPASSGEDGLLKRTSALLHVDDPERAALYLRLLADDPPAYGELTDREQLLARMLFFSLWPGGGGFASYGAGLSSLARHRALRAELAEVVALGLDRAEHVPLGLEPGLQQVPLATHASYSREEILAGLDYANLQRLPTSFMTGVVWSEAVRTDAFFVTLRKTERDYSPTTMYADYAISPELFHWESQNATSVESPVGQRYLGHRQRGTHILIFARQSRKADWDGPRPYLCLGPAGYVEHSGSRPIAITWKLRHPMPPEEYRAAAVAAG
jgi:superfamily II DNA or RNA helicase/HKD family nuclease